MLTESTSAATTGRDHGGGAAEGHERADETVVHLREPPGRRKRDIGLAMRPDRVAGFDDGITEIVEHRALPLIGQHRGLDLIDRPAGDFAGFLVTALG